MKVHEIQRNAIKQYENTHAVNTTFVFTVFTNSTFENSCKLRKNQAPLTNKLKTIEIKPVLQQSCIHGKASLAYVLAIFYVCEYNFLFMNTTFVFTESQAYQGFYPILPPVNTVNTKKKYPPLDFYIFNKLIF